MKKTIISLLTVSVLVWITAIACTKSNSTTLSTTTGGGGTTTTTCKTDSMSYTNDIVPIMQSYCYGCHATGSTGGSGGINLEGYASLKPYVDNGKLIGNITHAPGYNAMPFGQPKMPDCEISKIEAWVSQGTKNN